MKFTSILLMLCGTEAVRLTQKHAKVTPKLSQLMQPTAQELMAWLDTNESGEIELDELVTHLINEGYDNATIEGIVEEFHNADTDGSNSVNIDELEAELAGDNVLAQTFQSA